MTEAPGTSVARLPDARPTATEQGGRNASGSTSGGSTTRSRRTSRTSCASGRAASTTPARAWSSCTCTVMHPLRAGLPVLTEEAGAISEGFGDYWAVTVSEVVRDHARSEGFVRSRLRRRPDATSYDPRPRTPPAARLRPDDPDDLVGEVHADDGSGRTPSGTSCKATGTGWRTRRPAGPVRLRRRLDARPGRGHHAAAGTLYGSGVAAQVRAAFQARGIRH